MKCLNNYVVLVKLLTNICAANAGLQMGLISSINLCNIFISFCSKDTKFCTTATQKEYENPI